MSNKAQVQVVIPGIYIVSSEPTIEMANAGCKYASEDCGIDDIMGDEVVGIFQSMIAVAPPYRNGLPVALKHEIEEGERAVRRLRMLRKAAGYVENGSNDTVSVSQDDATRDWIIRVGKHWWYGPSLEQALDAMAAEVEKWEIEG